MSKRPVLRRAIVPAYIFLCIVLGGSSQGIWGNLILQLLALALIGWAAIAPAADSPEAPRLRMLAVIAIAAIVLVALQLVPLPPTLWTLLPGRGSVAEGYRLLRKPLPWLPLSLTPVQTLSSLLFLLPPIAIVVSSAKLNACRASWAVASILGATVLSVLLGYVQVSTKSPSWYLYDFTNIGSAVGFFANRDHMGTLLVVAIPLIAAVLADGLSRERGKSLAILSAGFSAGIAVLAGIAMNGSLAAVLLAFPVIAASALLFGATSRRIRVVGLVAVACASIVSLALLADSPVQGKLTGTETASIEGRQLIWGTSLKAARAAFPVGTGLGSFEQAFHLFEEPREVTAAYVNHAHDDYLELLVEGGLPALLLLAGFLVWFAAAARNQWRESGSRLGRAATIAAAAVLGHSLVDFPLRTTAIAAVFALCVALMAGACGPSRASRSAVAAEPQRGRHVVID